MNIKLSKLRELIREALVDTMREPKGPNSRDDAEDRDLDEADVVEPVKEDK